MKIKDIYVIKKDGTKQSFDGEKIVRAINASAKRIGEILSAEDEERTVELVLKNIHEAEVPILTMHSLVEKALDEVNPKVAKCYRDYRNYKTDMARMLAEVNGEADKVLFGVDRSNANSDGNLVSTKRALIFGAYEKTMYREFFLNKEERQADKDGYIYVHDKSARMITMNCCLFDMEHVLKGGFKMGGIHYNEPSSLDTAFDVIGDIILNTAAQQYGGFTVPEIDKVLGYYAEKSYKKYTDEYIKEMQAALSVIVLPAKTVERAHDFAMKKIEREFRQGWQGIEYKLNTVGSSRGDYPFVTVTFGLGVSRFERMCSHVMMKVHEEGQGEEGFKIPVLFPKYVFLYDKNLHCKDGVNHDIYEDALSCSSKTMYPDWLSLTGEGYVPEIYKKYGRVISPMGCRAFLSPWYERGGMYPADENDAPVYVGRFNAGVVSLHLPMILAKAREEKRDFYEVLDYYLQMIRNIHINTYEYLAKMKASTNPLAYCEGGFYGGHLKPEEEIRPLLAATTFSFGITALNELQELYNGKSIAEDSDFAYEVMVYINKKVAEFKEEDHILYAIYGTPAESLCGLQVQQFRAKYGVIKGVSDRAYVSNSFHCHVTEDISPVQKQDKEKRFWNLFNGGKIQYVRYPLDYNKEAIRSLVNRAMEIGFYEGVNFDLCYCNTCGYSAVEMNGTCPKCGSHKITQVDRMNGYLGITRNADGSSRYNDAKLAEIAERRSM